MTFAFHVKILLAVQQVKKYFFPESSVHKKYFPLFYFNTLIVFKQLFKLTLNHVQTMHLAFCFFRCFYVSHLLHRSTYLWHYSLCVNSVLLNVPDCNSSFSPHSCSQVHTLFRAVGFVCTSRSLRSAGP